MKSQIKQLTAGILLLGGTSATAENSTAKISVSSLLVGYITQSYSDAKIAALFESKIFELDPTQSKVIIDAGKLQQTAVSNQDQQLFQLVQSLQELASNDTFVEVVNHDDMVVATQDRSSPQ